MKKRTAILFIALFGALSGAHADLIDVVLFPYQNGGSLPPAYLEFLNKVGQSNGNLLFFDEARSTPYTIGNVTYPPGWVSQFGVLDGGQYFFTDLFSKPPDVNAQVSWNFSGSDKWLKYIDVFGVDSAGTYWTNLYFVPYGDQFDFLGAVELDGVAHILSISFYGSDLQHVPDPGATVVYLALGVIGMGIARAVGRRLG